MAVAWSIRLRKRVLSWETWTRGSAIGTADGVVEHSVGLARGKLGLVGVALVVGSVAGVAAVTGGQGGGGGGRGVVHASPPRGGGVRPILGGTAAQRRAWGFSEKHF